MAKHRKNAAQAAANFKAGVGQSQGKYIAGLQDPSVDWAGAATTPQATARRDQGLQAAIAAGTINEGISKAGTGKWRANAVAKGGATWVPQSQAATPTYQAGMQVVETNDWPAADQAMAQAGDAGTFHGRMARMQAWDTTLHNSARARKGLPSE